jgi:hypothetical protein
MLPLLAGCSSDDRCGPGWTRVEERCVVDAGPDTRFIKQDKGAPKEDGGGGGCAFVPTAADLVGTWDQVGNVTSSTCQDPMPTQGSIFPAEVTFAEDAGTINVTVATFGVEIKGTATIEQDGTVKLVSEGILLGITFSVAETLCFSDAGNATAQAQVSLSNAAGPVCDFQSPGTLTKK